MESQVAVDLGQEAIMTALTVGAPMLVVGVAIGLLIGLIQALTQIQDQTISSVPKIVTMVLVLGMCLPWLVERMVDYTRELIINIPTVVMGG